MNHCIIITNHVIYVMATTIAIRAVDQFEAKQNQFVRGYACACAQLETMRRLCRGSV